MGQIEHSRNMKTDALNHLSWFLPTARQRCRAVCLCHVFHETCLSRGRRSDKKPNLASAPGCPGVRSGHNPVNNQRVGRRRVSCASLDLSLASLTAVSFSLWFCAGTRSKVLLTVSEKQSLPVISGFPSCDVTF